MQVVISDTLQVELTPNSIVLTPINYSSHDDSVVYTQSFEISLAVIKAILAATDSHHVAVSAHTRPDAATIRYTPLSNGTHCLQIECKVSDRSFIFSSIIHPHELATWKSVLYAACQVIT